LSEAPVSVAVDSTFPGAHRDVLLAALSRRGIKTDEHSTLVLTASLSARPSALGIFAPDGTVMAPEKRRLFLQSCADTSYRLVLGIIDRRTGEIVGRGWAEEAHCKGGKDEAVPRLVRYAIAMLLDPTSRPKEWHWRAD
jgi:hypothetical protein